eukprot:scaffold18171_cov46-Attheya_sp.AAC.2
MTYTIDCGIVSRIDGRKCGVVTSEPAPELGQWTYDFSDLEGPQMGMVAIEGSLVVYGCDETIVIVADNFSIGVELPAEIIMIWLSWWIGPERPLRNKSF